MSDVTQWTEVSKVSTLDQCGHPKIQAWKFEDGTSASMWSCVVCGRKFEPLDLQQERDAKWYRRLRDGQNWPAVFARHDAPEPLRGVDLDKAMRAGDTHG